MEEGRRKWRREREGGRGKEGEEGRGREKWGRRKEEKGEREWKREERGDLESMGKVFYISIHSPGRAVCGTFQEAVSVCGSLLSHCCHSQET